MSNSRTINRRMALTAALGLMVAWAPSAWSQAWPSKPITFIVPNPPGGLVDTSARIIAEPLAKLLGATVVIENKAGASGNIAYQQSRWGPRTVILCW